jgi:hypothetical protein
MNDGFRSMIGAVLGASAAGVGATAAAPDAAPIFAVSLAGAGGAIGAGLHQLGRAVTIWIESDAAMRREMAAQLVAVRQLVESINKGGAL